MDSESEVRADLSASSGFFKGAGIVLILLGIGAILLPAVATLGVVLFTGWVLVIGAALIFVSAFMQRGAGDVIVRLLWALVALIAGLILLFNPDAGAGTLTLILAIYFILMGVVRLVVAAQTRGSGNAGWVAASGVISLILGLIIISDLHDTKDWAIGLLLGIDFIFAGWVLFMFGSAAKQIDRPS